PRPGPPRPARARRAAKAGGAEAAAKPGAAETKAAGAGARGRAARARGSPPERNTQVSGEILWPSPFLTAGGRSDGEDVRRALRAAVCFADVGRRRIRHVRCVGRERPAWDRYGS